MSLVCNESGNVGKNDPVLNIETGTCIAPSSNRARKITSKSTTVVLKFGHRDICFLIWWGGKTVRKEQKPISCSQEFTVSQSVKLLDGNIVIRKTNMISSKQSRNLLFLFVASIFIQSICAFQSSSRAPWQRILQGRGMIATSKISTISCSSTRARQEEKVDGETSFLMKPFTTTSGEIVYVVRVDFQTRIPRFYTWNFKKTHSCLPKFLFYQNVVPFSLKEIHIKF